MSFVVTRRLVNEAQEIFRSAGSALQMLRIYREDHPRFVEIIDNLVALLGECFKHHETFSRLTFALNNGHAVFQNLPLVDVGMTGGRLITTLQDLELEGFQLYRDMTREDLVLFLRNLAHGKRTGSAGGGTSNEGDEPEETNFCFLTKNSAKSLVQAANTRARLENLETISLKFHQIPSESFTSLLSTYKVLMTNLELGRALDYDKVAHVTDQAVSLFAENGNLNTRNNVASFSYFDDFTYHHSINVCLLATAVASRVVKDKEFLRRISLAALLHDVGKNEVPAEIIYKAGKLTAAEYDVLKEHSRRGAEILLSTPNIDPLCVSVAFSHHIHDGVGSYPETRNAYTSDWVSRLISVVDIYEALTAIRPYKLGLAPKTAFKIMLSMPGIRDRRSFIKLLYDCVSPYPKGSLVELTTGERGVVIQQNYIFPKLPRVRILTDGDLNLLTDPFEFDLADDSKNSRPDSLRRIRKPVVVQKSSQDPLRDDPQPEPRNILGSELTDDVSLMAREG